MTREELERLRKAKISKDHIYQLINIKVFDYSLLDMIMFKKKAGKDNDTYNDVIIMADTETSKGSAPEYGPGYVPAANHVCAWTVSFRAFDANLFTVYGHSPDELTAFLLNMQLRLKGTITYIYWHNLAYDWVFIRKFMFQLFGFPVKQLNTKAHYPVSIEFDNGLIFRDSLILAQRSLEKWALDMDVKHQKAVGYWDYEKVRNQDEHFTRDELTYIENDTLAGVECIQKLMDQLGKSIYSMPYTATGIPREQVKKKASAAKFKKKFNAMHLSYDQHHIISNIFHGGYTHGNRHFVNTPIIAHSDDELIKAYDFSSSYPFVMLSCKYPMERFTDCPNASIDMILEEAEEYAFMFKLILIRPRLKNDFIPMPALQSSKVVNSINSIVDNGRVLCADYLEIWLNEVDLAVIAEQYTFDKHICVSCQMARKDYLPRWFTDYIYECYSNKCTLKGGDPVKYAIAKSIANSLYGLTVQSPIRDNLKEDYDTGEFAPEELDPAEEYQKYLEKRSSILPYQWGVWVTSYAFANLFKLGACCDTWLYSDTDSCYGQHWDLDAVSSYNEECKKQLLANGYGPVIVDNREFWLGIAEHEGNSDEYTEFMFQGAKRYCGRKCKDGKLHITVAGVPKKGVAALNDDINNFVPGAIFPGAVTGKKLHTYLFVDEIYTDENGNLVGDSIDLSPCDYELDTILKSAWEETFYQRINIQTYGDNDEIL